jgi:hypothetical protein
VQADAARAARAATADAGAELVKLHFPDIACRYCHHAARLR